MSSLKGSEGSRPKAPVGLVMRPAPQRQAVSRHLVGPFFRTPSAELAKLPTASITVFSSPLNALLRYADMHTKKGPPWGLVGERLWSTGARARGICPVTAGHTRHYSPFSERGRSNH